MMTEFYALRQRVRAIETFYGTATLGCRAAGATALAVALLTSCIAGSPAPIPSAIHTADAPSPDEEYCAWFGDVRDGVLYFGQSAFWSTFRSSGGRPTADLGHAGPALIGRFDLASEQLLPPLDVTAAGDRSGVWDVLAHPNGRVYFTTYFASAGYADLTTGEVRRFEEAGAGLNEITLGPGGNVLISRYGVLGERDRSGGVVLLDPDGAVLAEYPLTPPAGFTAAPKTVAYDRLREEIWVTADLLPIGERPPARIEYETYVLDGQGVQLRRIETPEIQFIAFAEGRREEALASHSPAGPEALAHRGAEDPPGARLRERLRLRAGHPDHGRRTRRRDALEWLGAHRRRHRLDPFAAPAALRTPWHLLHRRPPRPPRLRDPLQRRERRVSGRGLGA